MRSTIEAIGAGVRCLYAHAIKSNTTKILVILAVVCTAYYYHNNSIKSASKFYSSGPDYNSREKITTEMDQQGIEHRVINANGINMHVAEKGKDGPVILFIHGFPELWYSWRHQITAFASLGYRAVAPDLRGYGETDAPDSASSYTVLNVVGDLISLLDVVAPDQEKVFVVGHDWGALMAWWLSLFRPDRVKALVNLSVVFNPRNPNRKPLDTLTAFYGHDYYICRFQVPPTYLYL